MAKSAKEVVRLYLVEIASNGKDELIEGLFSPRYRYHGGGGEEVQGLDGLRNFIGAYRSAFPDFRATPDVIVDGGNMIAVRYTFTGTHKGALGKIRPTGKKVTMAATFIVRLSRGKIIEEWEVADELELMKQIGKVKL